MWVSKNRFTYIISRQTLCFIIFIYARLHKTKFLSAERNPDKCEEGVELVECPDLCEDMICEGRPEVNLLLSGLSFFCLSIFLFVHLSVYLSVCLSIFLFVHLSVCLSVHLSVCPSVYLSVCPSVYLSVCPSVCLSI